MDKLRPILAAVKKHYFWICLGIIALVGLVGWLLATGDIDKRFVAQKTEIDTRLKSANQIAMTANHPNQQYEVGMKDWLTKYRENIDQAWEKKWEAQQSVLSWPSELNVGGKNFSDAVNGILLGRPIEALTEEDKELPVRLRELYRDYIKEELPKVADIIHATWAPTSNGGVGRMGFEGGMGGMGGMSGMESGGMGPGNIPLVKQPLVMWNPANQTNIQSKSFDWGAGAGGNMGGMPGGGNMAGGNRNLPTTLEVLYAQENLWVLQNLMKIIAKTNGEISSPHQATIKAIDSIEFGREVMPIRSRVVIPRSATPSADGDMMGMDGMGMDGMGMEGMGPDGMMGEMGMDGMGMDGMMGEEGVEPNPGDYRYVDKDYKKLLVDDLRQATTSPTSENYYLSVAKRLPVRLRLLMDQREVDKLLVECGNADLMVEVRQVRVNPTTSGAGGSSGGPGGGMNFGGMANMGGEDFGGPGGMGGGQNGNNPDQNEKIFDVPVEIYGIIYIYNPVNKELLWPEGSRPEGSSAEEATPETAGVTATSR